MVMSWVSLDTRPSGQPNYIPLAFARHGIATHALHLDASTLGASLSIARWVSVHDRDRVALSQATKTGGALKMQMSRTSERHRRAVGRGGVAVESRPIAYSLDVRKGTDMSRWSVYPLKRPDEGSKAIAVPIVTRAS